MTYVVLTFVYLALLPAFPIVTHIRNDDEAGITEAMIEELVTLCSLIGPRAPNVIEHHTESNSEAE